VPVVGDINGDGSLEIFVDLGEKRELFGLQSDGTDLPGKWPVHLDAAGLGKTLTA
jgi:hypothetical protein